MSANQRDCTLFLSFDEWAEVCEQDWIREATEQEVDRMKEERALGDRRVGGQDDKQDDRDWQALFEDRTGRPYLLVTVLCTAPERVLNMATGHVRLFRF